MSIPFFSLAGYRGPPLKPTQRCFSHGGRLQAGVEKYSTVLLLAWSPRRAPSRLTGRTPRFRTRPDDHDQKKERAIIFLGQEWRAKGRSRAAMAEEEPEGHPCEPCVVGSSASWSSPTGT
ncbi:hypothetical protein B296_00048599 [Ensete ventricosum]|uniref:Uncharacterized protein n=1 Tax=Ensete ventricosum TaxID=4639 RepID=A0A426XPT2_ENSVE|nr:hypothetical protein B296_00048599 [Ensete ventricosum]